jgi:RHS repeat-associated protein
VAISNGAGTVTNVNTYDEYGRPGTANVGRFQYTGQKWIAELGLYDYKARMYHPGLGRFMQTDPIGYASGMNLYAYVRDDPVNFADPFGLSEEDPFNWHIMYRADPPPQPGGIWDCNPRLGPCVWRPDIGITAGSSSGPSLGMSLWARSVGMPLGRELLGRGSGGDTGANRRPQPERPQEKPFKKLARCAAEQFGIDDLVDAGLVAAGQPIRGTKPFVTPGSSRGTSLAGMAADEVFGNARLPRQLPTVVGGPGTGRALAISGTKSVARFAGRAVPVIGWVMLAYDVASIAACAASGGE